MGEARDRVHLFLDPDIPFLELGAFAGYKLDSSSHPWTLFLSVVARWDRVRVREHQISDSVESRRSCRKPLMSTFTLSEAAEKRKERLLALKKRKRGQTDDPEAEIERRSPPQPDPSSPQPEGKPYVPLSQKY